MTGALTPRELSEHCDRMEARLEEKRAQLVGMDPQYAVWTNVQIDALQNRVAELRGALAEIRRALTAAREKEPTA